MRGAAHVCCSNCTVRNLWSSTVACEQRCRQRPLVLVVVVVVFPLLLLLLLLLLLITALLCLGFFVCVFMGVLVSE